MSPSFIAAFQVNLHVFGYTKPLSILLQGSSMDILTVYQRCRREEMQRRSLTQFMQEWSQWIMQLAWKQHLFQGDVGFRQQGIMWNHQHLKSIVFKKFEDRFSQLNENSIRGLKVISSTVTNLSTEDEDVIIQYFKDENNAKNKAVF